ncbi:MAG: class I SAM-dependent rRNA methyltransferase [Nitrospinota bacterium]
MAIHITPDAQRQIRGGHPWLFDQAIKKQSHNGGPGDLAVIYDRNNNFLAIGIYDPFSPIRVRVLQNKKPAEINIGWFAAKIRAAAEIRNFLSSSAAFEGGGTNGYRLVHGENDGLPGLVIDRYANSFVVKIYTAAWVVHLADVVAALLEVVSQVERVVLRINRLGCERPEHLHGLENGRVIFGPPFNKAGVDGAVVFKENGLLFEVDPVKGQKTGFFLDQRENRARVEKISGGKDVLDVFSYCGAFSLYAARGGAKSVTGIDISKIAIVASKRNFGLNSGASGITGERIAACRQIYITGDAFKEMEKLRRDGKSYDLVIVDPPPFAKKKGEVKGAIKAYSKLTRLALGVLRRGGVLVACSCSSRVTAEEFFRAVFESARGVNRNLKEIERSQHAVDHPIGFPEGAYLKCLIANA